MSQPELRTDAERQSSTERTRWLTLPPGLKPDREKLAFLGGTAFGIGAAGWLISRATGLPRNMLVRLCHWEVLDLLSVGPDDIEVVER